MSQPGQSAKQISDEAARRRQRAEVELELTRARATSWAKGVGALLAAGLAFGLVKGRSDISDLSPGVAALVGLLLLAATAVAVIAVHHLFRAAYGRLEPEWPGATEHELAVEVMADLRAGLRWALVGTSLLLGAVGLTWYGPAADGPRLKVVDAAGTAWCGEPVRTSAGTVTLEVEGHEVRVGLGTAVQIRAVNICPTP